MKSRFNFLWMIVKIAAGVVLLLISFRGVTWSEIFSSMTTVDSAWLVITILSVLIGFMLKVLRWVYLLTNYSVKPRFRTVIGAYFLAQAVDTIFPVHGGELLRVGVVTAEVPSSFIQTGITIAIEKLVDLFALLALALITFGYFPINNGNWIFRLLIPFILGVLVILVIMIIFGPKYWQIIKKYLSGVSIPIIQKGIILGDRLVETSMWLRDYRKIIRLILFTILIWITMWSTDLLLFKSVHLPVNPLAGGLVLVFGFLKVLPIGLPGNFGTGYFFTELALKPFAIHLQSAAIYAIILHALVTLPPLLVSPIYLLLSGIDVKSIKAMSQKLGVTI